MKPEDKELFLKLSDINLLGLLLYLEGRGEPIEGRIAIANVVRNRTRGKLHYFDVIIATNQFSCLNSNDPNYPIAIKTAQVLSQAQIGEIPDAILRECVFVSQGVVSGFVLDNTKGAKYYFNPSVCRPSWAAKMAITRVIGNHQFLREG